MYLEWLGQVANFFCITVCTNFIVTIISVFEMEIYKTQESKLTV